LLIKSGWSQGARRRS